MNRPAKKKSWINLAVFEDANDGEAFAKILRNQGFEARVFHDKLLQLFLFLCPPHATFRVQLHANDFNSVTAFLDVETPPILQKALHCPACGSLRVQYPQMTRKFFLPTLLLHLGIIFRVIEHEAYCENCHNVWNLPKQNVANPKARPAN